MHNAECILVILFSRKHAFDKTAQAVFAHTHSHTHASHLTAPRRHAALHLLRLLSIDLDVPLARLLELRELLLPDEAPRGRDALKRLEDARQHRLQPAEVDVRAVVEPVEELLRVLGETILDVHLLAVGLNVR